MGYDGTLEFDTRIDESGFKKGLGALENITGVALGNIGADLFQAGVQKLMEGIKKVSSWRVTLKRSRMWWT